MEGGITPSVTKPEDSSANTVHVSHGWETLSDVMIK